VNRQVAAERGVAAQLYNLRHWSWLSGDGQP
jgi:hypothetical protein